MRTTRFSALPYWLGPRRMGMSAPSVGGVGERAQQKWHVVVPPVGDREGDGDLRVEALLTGRRVVGGGAEPELIGAGRDLIGSQVGHPAVVVGDGVGEDMV